MDLVSLLGPRTKGVHPPGNKVSAGRAIERAPLPSTVHLPVSQHLGAPAKPVVKRGEEVLTGQLIAGPGGYVSAPVHATVSGKVSKITQTIHFATGRPVDVIVIESDGEDRWVDLEPANPASLSREEILKRIWDAGLVGLGGATFPTHVKLKPPEDKPIDTLIINGAECEPWITSDNRLMIEHGREIVSGIEVMLRLVPAERVIVAIERNKPEAIERMWRHVSRSKARDRMTVRGVPTRYPMGGEKTLTQVLLGREVPIGGLPLDVGVIVQNVGTVKAIHDAVVEGRPLVERVVTVTGMVREPANLLVRFGTPAREIIDLCGGPAGDPDEVIFGGPMMGVSQASVDAPVIKGTNCVLLQRQERRPERDCIRCASCIHACPMDLMPTMYVAFAKAKMWEACGDYHIDDCIECGSCAYSCPASIPIVQYIKLAKGELRKVRARK
ncbi:MAG TPA: electron transport complex subunit RsxC [Thermoplasmata archaeon]|nr:electron transport complex subunit RsxC [Thermoplasmata archaeon]